MIFKAPAEHELIHKQSVVILTAVPDQLDQIGVAELAEEVDLGQPLPVALKALFIEDLDGHRERFQPHPHILINVALVHSPEASLAQDVVGPEALGDGLELVEGEGDDVRVEHGILPRVLEVAWSGRIAQI